jgi:chemosensory pili system protein ChpA (sensor histidine kinase/response regulator)
MSANPDISTNLHWVQGELVQSLSRVRGFIEQHMETPASPLPLQQAVVELHQVRGTADMIQCAGVAGLTEEMKHALQDLLQGRITETEAAYSALLGASVQMSDYIDALASGLQDSVLVFHPAINELRVARGKGVLSEAELFAEQQAHSAMAVSLPAGAERQPGAAQSVAKKFQHTFHQNLLLWIKGEDVQLALGRLGKVAEQLAAAACTIPVYQLWRMTAAVSEALLTRGLDDSPDLKRLYGRARTQLSLLAEDGEDAAAKSAALLPFQFLYYVGRSKSQGPRVSAVKQAYPLTRALPTPETLESLRQKVRGPNTTLLTRLSEEIRKDLTLVKDSIDLAVRAGDKAPDDLKTTVEKLTRVATTLNMLGLSALQSVIQSQARRLEAVKPQATAVNDPVWLEVATALLRVEHTLDESLSSQLRHTGETVGGPGSERQVPDLDVREGRSALLRELLVDLAKLKVGVDGYLKSGDDTPLHEGARLLGSVESGLRVLASERAASLAGQIGQYMQTKAFAGVRSEKAKAEQFADAIAGVEYYLEALQKQQPDTERLVDNLARYVEKLEVPAEVSIHDTGIFKTPLLAAVPAAHPPVAAPPATPATTQPVVLDEVDPEIRVIFLDEAGEVLGRLQECLPKFKRDTGDRESLTEIRRAFHTLKGSGRMVGAKGIGEFAWAVENMINRCLEGTLALSPPVLEVIEDAVTRLPPLIENFRNGSPPDPAVAQLMDRAHRLIKGKQKEGPDTEIVDVFCNDARERIAAIADWAGKQDRQGQSFAIEDSVVREFHTIKGAASLVHAEGVSRLSGELENYLSALRETNQPLPAPGFQLLSDAVAQLREWVGWVAEKSAVEPDLKPWLTRLAEVQSVMPAEAMEAATNRSNADQFALEAFSRLEEIERAIKAWSERPDTSFHPRELQRLFQALRGDAVSAQCAPLGLAAEAFEQRVSEIGRGPDAPGAGFFRNVAGVIEEMYRQLDDFREGKLKDTGIGLATRILRLGLGEAPAPASAPAPAAAPAAAPPAAAEPVAPAEPVSAAEATAPEAEEVLEMPPVAGEQEPVAASDEFEAMLPMETAVDPELVAIFLAEAEELLDTLDKQFARWQHDPAGREPLAELARALHTLKGGARMAGLMSIGEVGHRLESVVERVAQGAIAHDTVLHARLHHVMDGLYRMLDEVKRGETPNAEAVLQELEDLSGAKAAGRAERPAPTAPPPEPEEVIEIPPVEEAEAAPVATEEVQPPAPAEEPPAGFDAELAEIFTAEAGELLEQLEASLAAWQKDPKNQAPLRDMQRSLHTLKGGARMAGVMAMGTTAHEMESLAEKVEHGQAKTGAETFTALHSQLEQLQRMHDRLVRGEAATLARETVSAPMPAAARAAAEPRVEVYAEPEAPPAPQAAPPTPAEEPEPVEAKAPAVAAPPVRKARAAPGAGWDPQLFWTPDEGGDAAAQRMETARVPVDRLDKMLNEAGEISIYRSRIEQHNNALQFQLNEMQQTLIRVRDHIRAMDIETEAQIAARGFSQDIARETHAEFDPLEMDRYSRLQELSRTLSESIGDVASLRASMEEQLSETETLLMQQSRVNTQVQQGLMGTLMVPFSRQVQRLQRVVRQTAQESGKQAEAKFEGIEQELDRNVLERMTAPLEHLLRNSVVHGIEEPAVREKRGKPPVGTIRVSLRREGSQLVIDVQDDGKGLDYEAIRRTATERGLMTKGAQLRDSELAMFIFEAGFSTAKTLTQTAGRGVGMDVVASEVKQLGGSLELSSQTGQGARFLIRLPLTLALAQALLVGVGTEVYAIPLSSIESIVRIPKDQLADYTREDGPRLNYGGQEYTVQHLTEYLKTPRSETPAEIKTLPAVLVRVGEGLAGAERRAAAVVVDTLFGNREIVSKAVGPQVSSVQGVSGGTILPDGRVVLILDVPALVTNRARRTAVVEATHIEDTAVPLADERQTIMVVDDSITIRRITERLLDRHGFRVVTAKDGLDAMAQLQTELPATILLDIEMPRADGFEVAAFVRNNERLRDVPIIMITSRSGEKHRERAKQIGVNRYVIKPYQEDLLLAEVREVLKGGA